jgi:hypothetical protein
MRFEQVEKGVMLVELTTEDHKITQVELAWRAAEASDEGGAAKE